MGSPPLQLRFVLSAEKVGSLPGSPAEIAVVGRSNVGKSSLINALANNKNMALTSKTPGRTRLLNCFALAGSGELARAAGSGEQREATLVDCPGYGYAKTSKAMRASWGRMIEDYLLQREQLNMILVLVDGEIGPTPLDTQMLDWVRANTLPHTVIATKHDKVKASGRDKRKRELAVGCQLEPSDIVWVSAAKGTGIDRLRDLTRLWLS